MRKGSGVARAINTLAHDSKTNGVGEMQRYVKILKSISGCVIDIGGCQNNGERTANVIETA
jgi:hypothetical protein